MTAASPVHDLAVTSYRVADLRTYHRNPRVGNVEVIRRSLRTNGQFKPIVVNAGTHTGRPNEVLAGNHTLLAARDEGWEHVAGVTVDVDEDQAARIVAADNRTADLGEYDDRQLVELLGELPDLDGTGFDPADLEKLVRDLSDASDGEWSEAFDGAGGSPDGPSTNTRTFSLHADQADLVDRALEAADAYVTDEHLDLNANRNGARLTVMAEHFMRGVSA